MARGRESSLRIVLSSEERQTLERWQRSTTLAAGVVRRGRIDLYTRPLRAGELVLSLDETTSLQPRPRPTLTLPAQPPQPAQPRRA